MDQDDAAIIAALQELHADSPDITRIFLLNEHGEILQPLPDVSLLHAPLPVPVLLAALEQIIQQDARIAHESLRSVIIRTQMSFLLLLPLPRQHCLLVCTHRPALLTLTLTAMERCRHMYQLIAQQNAESRSYASIYVSGTALPMNTIPLAQWFWTTAQRLATAIQETMVDAIRIVLQQSSLSVLQDANQDVFVDLATNSIELGTIYRMRYPQAQ